MGYDYYEDDQGNNRNIIQVNNGSYSNHSNQVMRSVQTLHPKCDPQRMILCTHKNPIVMCLDVTGSMGDWSKVIYDKLPMFYGEICDQQYLEDPAISFCGVGDANTDDAPLQVTEFGKGIKLDNLISQIWLEGKGGGNDRETYELAAYYYVSRCKLQNVEGKGIFFFTGDEGPYPYLVKEFVEEHLGEKIKKNIPINEIFEQLREKFHVFYIHKPYFDKKVEETNLKRWESVVGSERILKLDEAKGIVDLMLGAIALVSGTKNLQQYHDRLVERQQDEERISMVENALSKLSEKLKSIEKNKNKNNNNNNDNNDDDDDDDDDDFVAPQSAEEALELARRQFKNLRLSMNDDDDDISNSQEDNELITLQKELARIRAELAEFPENFLCPITQEPFIDPVFTCDGHTYEREAITKWLATHGTSPMTNDVLSSFSLIPNHALRNAMTEFKKKYGKGSE